MRRQRSRVRFLCRSILIIANVTGALSLVGPILSGEPVVGPMAELQFNPGTVEWDGSFTATFSGTNLTSETYFDVRFRAPCIDKDEVALNWQRGVTESHRVPVGSPTGVWTITGVWAHQDINDHSSDFAPSSTTLLVYQHSSVPFGGKVTSIAVDPSRSATVYAATIGSGTYKTCDGGRTWTASGAGLPDADILALALDPASPWIVYAGTSVGVFKSVNGGVSWNIAGSDLSSTPVRALAIDPLRPATIYAATELNGVFKSVDGGLRWSVAGKGMPAAATVQSLAIDPVNSDIVYAGTHTLYPAFAQIFKSTDGGGHWDFIFERGESMSALVVDPKNPFVIYAGTFNPDRGNHNDAGVFKSTNGGQFWYGLWSGSGANYESSQPGHRYIESLVIDPVNSAVLYAGGKYPLVFKSTDAGASWTRSEIGDLSNGDIQGLAIDPSTPSTIYAGAQKGIFKSIDAGATWRPLQ